MIVERARELGELDEEGLRGLWPTVQCAALRDLVDFETEATDAQRFSVIGFELAKLRRTNAACEAVVAETRIVDKCFSFAIKAAGPNAGQSELLPARYTAPKTWKRDMFKMARSGLVTTVDELKSDVRKAVTALFGVIDQNMDNYAEIDIDNLCLLQKVFEMDDLSPSPSKPIL